METINTKYKIIARHDTSDVRNKQKRNLQKLVALFFL